MSKKMMLLALAVASAALFALPAFASAEEIHFDTATSFTGTGPAGNLVATNEPTIDCSTVDVTNGTISAGGTTGTMTLDFTGCKGTPPFGEPECHSKGSALNNTIATGSTFHLITWKNSSGTAMPAVLVTMNATEIFCETFGINFITFVTGNVIGTITSPACGTSSNKMVLSFSATGSTQNHLEYTGSKYDLIARTGAAGVGEPKTAALNSSATLTANTAGTLTCT